MPATVFSCVLVVSLNHPYPLERNFHISGTGMTHDPLRRKIQVATPQQLSDGRLNDHVLLVQISIPYLRVPINIPIFPSLVEFPVSSEPPLFPQLWRSSWRFHAVPIRTRLIVVVLCCCAAICICFLAVSTTTLGAARSAGLDGQWGQ